jgi:carbon monoxide dehydrogenase subunit G
MVWLLAAVAIAGGKWDGRDPNITAGATLEAPPDAIYAILDDAHAPEQLFPHHCASDFDYGVRKAPEADVRLTYHLGPLDRRLDATWTRRDPNRLVEIDHQGNKGFITRWTLAEVDGGTRVEVTTFINPPPWPVRRYYYTRVRPAWTQCYLDALEALDGMVVVPQPPGREH